MTTSAVATQKPTTNYITLAAFVAGAVAVWAGIDANATFVAVLGAVVLVLAACQLMDKPNARGALVEFVRRRAIEAYALQVAAAAGLLWLSIDLGSQLGAIAGAALTMTSSIGLIKSRKR